ncbi:uncharacterized protein BDZ99DRAFT_478234 [Mytilinidion resinicola]|uniref:Uncharacterized protein n=1 Tax=Mytilinidion resinicola TaxID=574789 RepID=A0A6A6YI66_9PEZI|nr:uncharacterized protein BDZ99DRAFT_478234 [Mytilinidion resinicola]KAF2807684.1 hypothetical protein BDZ99DRAFT_478234 [Mytilinidion resinicola]
MLNQAKLVVPRRHLRPFSAASVDCKRRSLEIPWNPEVPFASEKNGDIATPAAPTSLSLSARLAPYFWDDAQRSPTSSAAPVRVPEKSSEAPRFSTDSAGESQRAWQAGSTRNHTPESLLPAPAEGTAICPHVCAARTPNPASGR